MYTSSRGEAGNTEVPHVPSPSRLAYSRGPGGGGGEGGAEVWLHAVKRGEHSGTDGLH